MATTEQFLTGTGATPLGFTTEYLTESDIKVRVNGGNELTFTTSSTPTTGQYYIPTNGTTIKFGDNYGGTDVIHIYRKTDFDSNLVSFTPGSSIKAADLNLMHQGARFGAQEARQQIIDQDIRPGVITSSHIKDGTLVDADISGSAAIAQSKLATGTLPSGIKVNEDNILDEQVTSAKIKDGTIVGADISDSAAIPFIKLATGLLPSGITINSSNITNGSIKAEDLETGTLDGRYYTETEAEALFLRQDSSETLASGTAWSNADDKVATTAAISARIIDLIEEVGGFVPVTNETSFPDYNPDINNGNGTVVSVQAVSTNLVPTGGSITITNGRGTGKPVIITGVTATIPQNFGMILETTSTTHTYAFHRLTAIATEVHTVASNITSITNVNTNLPNIQSVLANETRINKVAANETNINIVSGELTEMATDLGFITNPTGTFSGNDINTVADNIDSIKDVADEIEAGTFFHPNTANKVTGSIVYFDGTSFKADATTTKSTLVTGGNF